MDNVRSVVNRILSSVGLVRDPQLQEVISISEERNRRINEQLDRMELTEAIRTQAQRDERRVRERFR